MKRIFLPFLLLVIGVCNGMADEVLAFPGAEGFGRYASGGRGGKVVIVTSTEDYTAGETPIAGTLRWALSQYVTTETDVETGRTYTVYEPLTIVFNVAGNIELKEDLKVKRSNLTIAGQTAPGQGVCITGHSMTFNGATGGELWKWGPNRSNVIVRYMRFRPNVPDSSYVTYGTDIENYDNFIMDHCTMTWANEECLAIYDTRNTTVQWCIIAEGLYSANHKKGKRSYCGVWGGQFASYHHNLVAHNDSRNIRFNGARSHDTLAVVDYHNNVVYNWGTNNSGYGLEMSIDVEGSRCELNMFNNYYKHGPASPATGRVENGNKSHRLVRIDQTKAQWDAGRHASHYVEGNYITNFPDVAANNWNYGVQFQDGTFASDTALSHGLFRSFDLSPEVAAVLPDEVETADEAFSSVMAGVGATCPARDWQDQRIVNEATDGTAIGRGSKGKDGIIDDPAVVGGWPILTGEARIDTDGDGMPDTYEQANGLNPNDPTDGPVICADGYSNLEHYLNGISPIITALSEAVESTPIQANMRDGVLYIDADTEMSRVSVFDAAGKTISSQDVSGRQVAIKVNTHHQMMLIHVMMKNGQSHTCRLLNP